MRLYTFDHDGVMHVGAERNGEFVDLTARFPMMLDLIRGGDESLAIAHHMVEVVSEIIPIDSVRRLLLNGEVMQDRTNADWCFPLPRLLAWFAMGITLYPGDIVSTGTPAGIGYFRKPQVFLKPGAICVLEIEGIGRLENPVVGIATPPHLELHVDRAMGRLSA